MEMAGVETNFRDDAVHGAVGAGQQGIVAADGGMHSGGEAGNVTGCQLAQGAFRPLGLSCLCRSLCPLAGPFGRFRHHVQARDVLTLCRIIDGAGFHRPLQDQVHPACALGVPGIGLVGDGELFFEIFKNFALTAFARPDVRARSRDRRSFAGRRHGAFPSRRRLRPPDHHD